jgi:hypothetical protein
MSRNVTTPNRPTDHKASATQPSLPPAPTNPDAQNPKRWIHHNASATPPSLPPAPTNPDAQNPKRWGGLGEERRSLPPN